MKILIKTKAWILMTAFALALVFTGNVAAAKTVKSTEKQIYHVGSTKSVSGADIKINKKSLSKMKKKVKAVKTGSDSKAFSYHVKDYTEETEKNALAYKKYTSYELTFLKAGTYTITVTTYGKDYGSSSYVNDEWVYSKDELVKYVTTYKIKVLKTDEIVASVQLGKAKISNKTTWEKTGGYSSISTRKTFLSGSKGKLTVKMADKNYKIQSIIIATYDKKGNKIYKAVKNKKSVTFGKYKRKHTYSYSYEDGGKYYEYSTQLFKPTEVYISYKNMFTGEYTKWTVKKDKKGKATIVHVKNKDSDGDSYTYDTEPSEFYGDGICTSSYTFYKK